MSQNESAYTFWQRVDKLNADRLNVFCEKAGLDYNKVKHNRSDVRYMNCVETLEIAKHLGTTVEYLLTGQAPRTLCDDVYEYMEKELPSLLDDIVNKINMKKGDGSCGNRA